MSSGGARVHVPVLRDRVIELLAPALAAPGAVLVDATLGLGGHTRALLEACPGAVAVGIDRDRQALVQAAAALRDFGPRLRAVHAAYDRIGQVLADLAIGAVQAVLFDLGVSSMQLDQTERGFAYRVDAPLDMRMDQDNGLTAARVLNEYDAAGLERILREYGEERYAARIARAVVREREREPFSGSGRLVRLLHQVIPAAAQRTGGHPAKQTFQALRIEVNGELASWRRALPAAIRALAIGGRVAVLSYHSLEDRVAKQELAAGARDRTPQDLPVPLPGYAPYLRLLTHGAERASAQESHDNPRATSARLRAAERIRKEQPA